MTDPVDPDELSVPVVVTDPEDDEDAGDELQLAKNGWVRFRVNGERYRLRRPFLGELRDLRLALEDVQDQIGEAAEDVQLIATEMMEKSQALEKDESATPAAVVKGRRKMQRESTAKGRELTLLAETLRIGWWERVFATLDVDKANHTDPVDLPAWIVDTNLPGQVLQHWRDVPLARGK